MTMHIALGLIWYGGIMVRKSFKELHCAALFSQQHYVIHCTVSTSACVLCSVCYDRTVLVPIYHSDVPQWLTNCLSTGVCYCTIWQQCFWWPLMLRSLMNVTSRVNCAWRGSTVHLIMRVRILLEFSRQPFSLIPMYFHENNGLLKHSHYYILCVSRGYDMT